MKSKVRSLEQMAAASAKARAAGRRVVQCHGVFDLLHLGHIRHLNAARAMGDLLFVTLTPDRFVNKGPRRPCFNDAFRAEALAALDCVDLVAVNRWPTSVEAIGMIRPSVYVKGSDYRRAKDDVTGGIKREEAAVRTAGGRLAFTDDIIFSSTSLLNQNLSSFPPAVNAYLVGFRRRHGLVGALKPLSEARKLKVLVIGEAIIDEYVYCEAIGKSSKEPTLVLRQCEREAFVGGSLAVANHVAGLGAKVRLVTFLGSQNSHLAFIKKKLRPNVSTRFLYRKDAPTIVKRRYVEQYHFTKMLEIYEINDAVMSGHDDRAVRSVLSRELPRYDVVIVVDYGHGMLSEKTIRLICRKAKYLAINAQSNAGNLGYHTIDRYPRADLACLTENEMRMEARDRRGDMRLLVPAFSKRTGFSRLIVTRGKYGCLGYDRRTGFVDVPAVAGQILDRVGAGDAFLSVAALCDRLGAPLEVSGLIGNAAGARAVATVGNRDFIEKAALIKHLESLLK